MRKLSLGSLLCLVGCYHYGPAEPVAYVKVNTLPTAYDVKVACRKDSVAGCAYLGSLCEIYYREGDHETLTHEVLHCIYGEYH